MGLGEKEIHFIPILDQNRGESGGRWGQWRCVRCVLVLGEAYWLLGVVAWE